jgi:cell division septum initiation protein DivIVA
MILSSPRVPLTKRTLVDEEQLLDQLDLVRLNLPEAFQKASEIVRERDRIYEEAQSYAREIVEEAEQEAARILDEMGIVRQAKAEAEQIRQQVQQDCQAAQERTMAEIEEWRRQGEKELEQMRARAVAEAEAIEQGADEYADRVLGNIENQLGEMLRVVRNGRHQLERENASTRTHASQSAIQQESGNRENKQSQQQRPHSNQRSHKNSRSR